MSEKTTVDLDALDGRIGERWAGEAPNGSHVNVVLALFDASDEIRTKVEQALAELP